ncbi:MAG: hypothetical protein EU548_01350 [Promethearchaeota archaeon]|nr:MAG: hypothetical protein EU548_01350 [Candidatus Lokiarchaeota archaeon]
MKIGFASTKITPDLSERKEPLQLGGYSPRKLCTGIHDDLFARAVYIEGEEQDPSSHILMMVCDLLSIDGRLYDIVAKRIAEQIPVNPKNILISGTHTHHGPDFRGLFRPGGNLQLIKGFLFPKPQRGELIEVGKKLLKVAIKAYEARKEGKIGAAQTKIPPDERVILNRREPSDLDILDYPLTVIKITGGNLEDDRSMGVIVSYACHGTVLPRENTLITADYVGYLINSLKEKIGNPKTEVLYFNGPCGEINPLSQKLLKKINTKGPDKLTLADIYNQKGTWEDAQHVGGVIAKYAFKTLEKIKCQEMKDIQAFRHKIRIPIKEYPYGGDLLSTLNRVLYRIKLKLFIWLKKLRILQSNIFFDVDELKKGGHVNSHIQWIKLGTILIGTAPGEYFMELGKEVINYAEQLFPNYTPFLVELANDSIGYLYTVEAFRKGGYESSFSIIPLGGRFITMKLKRSLHILRKK